ncbi:MAG: carboxypeptidase-like regulatory domain-containing protein [Alistipes sp.]|nr:carboxypeptidase-like regulatory domain-containing protein [Alistipes sp.]
MKLKILLWIAAAVAAVIAGVAIFAPKQDKAVEEQQTVVAEEPIEEPAIEPQAPVVEEPTTTEAEEVAAKAEAERLAAEKRQQQAAAKRRAAEAEAEKRRAAAAKAEVERLAAEKAEAERVAAEQAAIVAKAEAERIAAEKEAAAKAEAERLAAEKRQQQQQALAAISGGVKGRVVSRTNRAAVNNVKVTIAGTDRGVVTDNSGNFVIEGVPAGDYTLQFAAPEYENLDVVVKVGPEMKDINTVVVAPTMVNEVMDDSIFAEYDNDSSASDMQALPSSLSASKDLYNNIASYRFSEMRFNVRGYDSKYSDIYLNGIRFNDALTGYGPWSLWSGMNDATRNQESTSGITASDYGIGGFGGSTNINARASQMRKGFRASVSGGNQMYNFRAILSYASGMLDSGWSYAFSVSTRQGGNCYVDGVYYNSYGYFAAVEKQFNPQHRLSLMVLGTPQQRGAQQASTQEAYDMFGSNYYNPNVGFQDGKLRNTRVRRSHEPIIMLNYFYDINDKTRLTAATSVRFGFNGYSALTWKDGADPRPDYYRYLPSNYTSQIVSSDYGSFLADNIGGLIERGLVSEAVGAMRDNRITPAVPGVFQPSSADQIFDYLDAAAGARNIWTGRMDFDNMINSNRNGIASPYADGHRSNYIIEERHTDQIDYNFAANIAHEINNNHRIIGGLKARVNRTEYYDKVKDLLGGDFWIDIDKFAERDMGSNVTAYQNDLDYYNEHGHPRVVREGDKFSYDYYAHIRQVRLWAMYSLRLGSFAMNLGAEAGYAGMWREGLWRKGLFAEGNESKGDSKHLNYLTYKAKANFSYRFSNAHELVLNAAAIQDAPTFNSAFVSPRTRNHTTQGLTTEKIYSAELTYNLNLPYIQARVSGYFTKMNDGAKVISFYDDTQSSFTNFAMSGIDKRYAGVEVALRVPIWGGIALQGALNYGDYRYTSNPTFVQTVDNSAEVKLIDKVYWKNFYVESTPQFAANVGLDFRGPKNWFASINFNYYDKLYLSMNPAYRTNNAIEPYVKLLLNGTSDQQIWALQSIAAIRAQEDLGDAWTLAASVGKNWYIARKYTLGFSAEVKNILNNQGIRTGGYEQMRMRRVRGLDNDGNPATNYYSRFDSKYFYMLGTTCFVNVYFRF